MTTGGANYRADAVIMNADFARGIQRLVPHHTIRIAPDYKANLREIDQHHPPGEDPSFYIQNPCMTNSTLAPAGKSTLYLLAPVSKQLVNTNWKTEASKMRRRLLEKAALLGFENLERRIEFEKVITPDDWESQYDIHLGATFNLAHTFSQLLHLRPRNRFQDVPELYLTGGGIHPGSGLPVIFESARITSRLLLKDLQ